MKTTTDFQNLLRDPAIDAIAIATQVSTHFELGTAEPREALSVMCDGSFNVLEAAQRVAYSPGTVEEMSGTG